MFLVLAIFLAGIAAWLSYGWLQKKMQVATPQRQQTVKVVVARQRVDPGHVLSSEDLTTQEWPANIVPKGSYLKPEEVVGRVTAATLTPDEVITNSKVRPEGIAGGLSAVLSNGQRAMTVRVDDVVGVGGFVNPGDHVDVLTTIARGESYANNPLTRIVLQNIKVLTTGERLQVSEKKIPGKSPTVSKARVVTLEVTPKQAEILALAAQEGVLILALRAQTDQEVMATRGTRLSKLTQGVGEGESQGNGQKVTKDMAYTSEYRIELIKGQKHVYQKFDR